MCPFVCRLPLAVRLTEKDLRDIVTILADTEVGQQDGLGMINAGYIGKLCADDWGLFYDVAMNLQRVDEGAASFGLSGICQAFLPVYD